MKRILFFAALLALVVAAVRRLNGLAKAVQSQSAQLEALRAKLDAQQAAIEEMRAHLDTSEAAMADGLSERQARWREILTDLDSPN